MGFLPFCVKPLTPLGLKAVGTVGTSDGKPVTARLSEGVCCSHSQFTKWEQWEHPSPCPLLLPALPTTARKGAPRPLPPVGLVLASCLPLPNAAQKAPSAPHLPASLAADPARPCGFPLTRLLHGPRRPAGSLRGRPSRRPGLDLHQDAGAPRAASIPLDAPAPVRSSCPRRLNSDGRVWRPDQRRRT